MKRPISGDDWLRLFQNAVEQTADLVLITGIDASIVYVNPAFERVTGWAGSELVGKNPRVLKSGVHDGAFYAAMWERLRQGGVFRSTIANRSKAGELFYIDQTISPIRDEDGRVTHYVSVGKDAMLRRMHEENESKLRVAREVQSRLFPSGPLELTGFEITGRTYPADSLGGDYFDYVTMPEGRVGLVVGDVSGHGLDAALLMSEARAFLRSFASVYSDVGQVLTCINRALSGDIDENRYVTMVLVRLDPKRRTVTYSSAGHETCFLYRRGASHTVALTSTGPPLGVFLDSVYDSDSKKIDVAQGDLLVLATDGLFDAENAAGTRFGQDRMHAICRRLPDAAAAEILDALITEHHDFRAGVRQQDDVTLVVCRAL